MTLPTARARAYLLGALTGAFAALSIVGEDRRRALFGALSLVCGAMAVAYEERADRMTGMSTPDADAADREQTDRVEAADD